MISNQILQETLEGIQAITKVDLIVMDVEGRLLAKTAEDGPLDYEDAVIAFAESQAESQSLLGYQFFKVMDDKQLEYIILAKGDSDSTYMVGKMASFQIQSLLVAYKEYLLLFYLRFLYQSFHHKEFLYNIIDTS
jgi:carbohydrate diacid regulator